MRRRRGGLWTSASKPVSTCSTRPMSIQMARRRRFWEKRPRDGETPRYFQRRHAPRGGRAKNSLPKGDGPNDAGSARSRFIHAAENALRRLSTDYIDLLQLHAFDAGTPI